MRIIVDLPETQIKALDSYRKREGVSRAEAVRRAVEAFIPARGKAPPISRLIRPLAAASGTAKKTA